MPQEIIIVPIYILNLDKVVNFLQNKYDDLGRSHQFWTDRTAHWWLNNPYFYDSLPIGWGIWDGKALVGYIGYIFTKLNYRGSLHTSLNLTCWYVEPKYRSYSLDLFMKANSFMPEAVYFNTSPSPQVENILKASKYLKYILGKEKISSKIIPLNLNAFTVDSKLLFLKKIFSPFIETINIIIKNFVVHMWDNENIVVTELKDVSHDSLDNFLYNKKTDKLTIDRSVSFYNWLLSAKYSKFHLLIVNRKSDSSILAVGLFNSFQYKNNSFLELIDFYSIDDDFYKENIVLRKMISYVFSNELFNKVYLGVSFTEYCGIKLINCPGWNIFRSRNNKYYKTLNSSLKSIFENNKYDLTAIGDMYL
jgi:hypothetical protein